MVKHKYSNLALFGEIQRKGNGLQFLIAAPFFKGLCAPRKPGCFVPISLLRSGRTRPGVTRHNGNAVLPRQWAVIPSTIFVAKQNKVSNAHPIMKANLESVLQESNYWSGRPAHQRTLDFINAGRVTGQAVVIVCAPAHMERGSGLIVAIPHGDDRHIFLQNAAFPSLLPNTEVERNTVSVVPRVSKIVSSQTTSSHFEQKPLSCRG